MLPTGHLAAGYLTAYGVVKLFYPGLSAEQSNQLLALGTFAGFAPDLDVFWFFLKHKTLLVANTESAEDSHRKFFSHAPFYWLLASLVMYATADGTFGKAAAIVFWLSSWSHFFLDSIEGGIPWLKPFSGKLYAFSNTESSIVILERNFIWHSLGFLKVYSRSLSFYFEILIILAGILVYFRF